jgi:Hypothetical glycosyl hydrolase family 15/Divergent InlB B-repeat domain
MSMLRLGAACALAGTLAACGGGDSSNANPASTSTVQTAAFEVSIGGSGTVTSSPTGLNCVGPNSCSQTFPLGTAVTLIAAPASGQTFVGWGGACSGTTAQCVIVASAAENISANFAPAAQMESLQVTVGGAGSVTSNPVGISCIGPATCSQSYASGTAVTLSAAPASGNTFVGWTGACSGSASTCTVTMNAAQSVGANFAAVAQNDSLQVTVGGSGTVTSSPAGINCSGSTGCSQTFASGTSVTLTAAPAAGNAFSGWSGACSGSATTCTVTMNAPTLKVGATFAPVVVYDTLQVALSGSGSVSSTPAGINCSASGGTGCSQSFANGTVVQLTAAPASGYSFSGWSGACSGTATTCSVAMSAAENVGAAFTAVSGGLLAQRIAAVKATPFPRRAALVVADFNLGVVTEQALLARFDLAMLGLYAGWSQNGLGIQAAAQALKTIKPSILVGNYSILNEAYYNTYPDARTAKLNATNWWLRDAAGNMVQWSSAYGAWDIDITTWAAPDANGQRYPQWVADWFDSQYFAGSSVFDFWYFDNVMVQPLDPAADWKRNGTNQNSSDADVAAAFRAGEAAEWVEARKLEPNMLLLGNVDSDLSSAEYKGQLNLALLECLTGQSWSIDTWGGWQQMMSRYLGVMANLAPPQVAVFSACGGATDYAMLRYSLASALMGDGYFAYSGNGSYSSASWYDEFNVNLGAALQPAATAAYQNGVYRRDFQNGIVLVNPRGNGRQTVTLGGTFHKIVGTQDPATNNGQAVTSVTLNAADGIVLTR